MHYVRFLKPPKFAKNGAQVSVKTTVTITTDLGDDFFHADQSLHAVVFGISGSVSKWKTVMWKAGMRAMNIEIDAISSAFLDETLALLVSSRHTIEADEISVQNMPDVLSARSRIITLDDAPAAGRTERVLRTGSTNIRIFEEMGESIARHVWDAANAMIAYVDHTAQIGHEKDGSLHHSLSPFASVLEETKGQALRIIELGSGCGVVGIWIATRFPNAQVIMTDLPEAMEILGINMSQARVAPGSMLEKQLFNWDEEIPRDIAAKTFDLMIVSDCTYNCDSIPSLVRTCTALLTQSTQALLVVSMKVRHDSELVFFDLISEAGLMKLEEAAVPLSNADQAAMVQKQQNAIVYIFSRRRYKA